MSTQAEAAAQLKAANDSLTKIGTETTALLQKITDLQNAAVNADQVSPELQAAIDGVVTQAKAVDDLVCRMPRRRPKRQTLNNSVLTGRLSQTSA